MSNNAIADYLSHCHLLFGLMTQEGRWCSLNAAWQQLGYDSTQLFNELYLNIVHPDDQVTTRHGLSQLLPYTSVTVANRCRHRDGSYRPVIWQFTQIADDKMISAVGTLYSTAALPHYVAVPQKLPVLEPSEQSHPIATLTQKINDLQTMFEGLQEAVVLQYADGQLQTLNNQFERLLGRAIEGHDFNRLWQAATIPPGQTTTTPHVISFSISSTTELTLAVQSQLLYHENETIPYAKMVSVMAVTPSFQPAMTVQQLQQHLELLMHTKDEVMLDWNLRTNQVHYSPPWKTLLGYIPEDLGTQITAWYSRIHPADHPLVIKEVKNCLDGIAVNYERIHRLQHKDGSYRWMRSQGRTLRDERGQLYRFLIIFTDVTDYKRLEQALEASKKYEQLFLALTETVLVIDGKGRILDVNPAAWQLYGYGRQELLQLKATDIFTTTLKLMDTPLPLPQSTHHKRKDGTLISVEVMVSHLIWQTQKLMIVTVRDVTAARETLATLIDNEARYRLLFEAVSDAVVIFDAATHRVVEVNSAASSLYGYSREEWLRLYIEDTVVNPSQSLAHLRTASRQKFYKIPIDWHRKNQGTVFPVEISTGSYKLKELTLVCAFIRDITERQKTEEDLRKTVNFANALIQTSPAFFITITPTGKISLLNDTLLQALGYRSEEVVGKDYLTLLIPEADRAMVAAHMNTLMSQQNTKMLSEMTVLTKDKQPLLVECHCCVMQDTQGQVEYLLALGIDIGERRQMLQELQMFKTIVENSNEAIAIRGHDKSLIYINAAHRQLFKHTFEEARQSFYRDYLPTTSRQKVNQEIRRRLEQEGKTWEGVLEMRNTLGQQFPVWARFDAVYGESGNILFAFSLMHDITEQQQMEAALRYEREQYETIFHAAPLMIAYKDKMGRFIRVNRYAANLFETTPELMQGQYEDQIVPHHANQYRAVDVAVIESGQAKLGIIEPYPKGYLRTDRIPYRHATGEILGVIVFSMDITEQIETERALRYEHEQYETIFHSAPLSIIYKDHDNRIIRANRYAASQMRVNLKQLQGLSMYDLAPEHAKEYHASDLEVIHTGKPKLGLIEKHRSGFSQVDKIPYTDADGKLQGVIVFAMNITKRIKMEQALRQQQQVLQENEAKLRLALKTLPSMIYVIDHQFNFVLWNRECEQVTGYTAAEIINNPQAWELLYPDPAYRKEMLATTKEMVDHYAGFRDWEWTLTCKDGSQKTILWSGASEAKTREFSLCAVGQDITEHDQVLQLLCDSEERIRLVIEKMPVLFIAYNESKQLVLWNRHCETITGYKAAEMLHNPKALEWLYPQPEYRLQVLEKYQKDQLFWYWETEITCKDGSTKLIAWSNISKELPVPGWFGWMVGENRSGLKQSQQLFSNPDSLLTTVLDSLKVAVCVTDGRGRYVYVNTEYCQLSGYDRQELIHQSFSIVLPQEQHHSELRHYFHFLTHPPQKSFTGLWKVLPKNGESVEVQVVAQRLEIEPVYVVWTMSKTL